MTLLTEEKLNEVYEDLSDLLEKVSESEEDLLTLDGIFENILGISLIEGSIEKIDETIQNLSEEKIEKLVVAIEEGLGHTLKILHDRHIGKIARKWAGKTGQKQAKAINTIAYRKNLKPVTKPGAKFNTWRKGIAVKKAARYGHATSLLNKFAASKGA